MDNTTKKYGLNELREMFLRFFESKGHLRLPSFSLIPQNDASLLLINSGMAPMKPWFTGDQAPPSRRVCTCQKCIRTGDIENIGHTARHGTYFEMLGNFSFGDYFKREAIAWSWEFLTSPEWVGLDPERLYPSVYQYDDEAFDIWRDEIGIAPERIFRFGKEDNFWEHGSGPCGPCSEIYYDRGPEKGCGRPGCTVGCDCDRYIEVWNNVFSQFNNDGQGGYTELKQKNIDTGMGLERLACICQGVDSLFDVDTVMNITDKVSQITGAHYGESRARDVSLRIITDHIRSATMMIADGVQPSNEGRGYVLRRLLRRAARHGRLLGVARPFLFEVCGTVIHENMTAYPELAERQSYITRVIKVEEENFARTIDGGLRIFSDFLAEHKAKGEVVFPGGDAFKLYDTYGFPIDLTKEMCLDEGMTVDEDAFRAEMEAQKARAREARKALGDLGWERVELGDIDKAPTEFLGYDRSSCTAHIQAIIEENELSGVLTEGKRGVVVLDRTCLYAEMGGQSGDHGRIVKDGAVFEVTDTQKTKAGKYLHYGKMLSGSFTVDDQVEASYDVERRRAIARAHSATHLLQSALRKVLGTHVHQAGSLVGPDRLRFDFTHFSAISSEQLMQVQRLVNDYILEGHPITVSEMSMSEATAKGAMALFSEKYGDVVRVVDMDGCSIELCGGTHLDNTAKAGMFLIRSENSVASGIRRIEATTGRETMDVLLQTQRDFLSVAGLLKVSPKELVTKTIAQMEEIKTLRKRIEDYKNREELAEAGHFLLSAKNVGELKVLSAVLRDKDPGELRRLGDFLRDKEQSIVAVLASSKDDKISLLAVCGPQAVKAGVKAGELIKKVAAICGGSGGGKPDCAMGGAKDAMKLDDALAAVDDFVAAAVRKE